MKQRLMTLLLLILLTLMLSASVPFQPPEWLTARFDAHWVEALDVGDTVYYFDDNRDLQHIDFLGIVAFGEVGSCLYTRNLYTENTGQPVPDAVPRLFAEPENEIMPWMFCDTRNERLVIWSSPNYHLPNRDPSIPLCKEPDIDSDELQVQTDCQVEHHDWITGHDKEIIEIVRGGVP